MKILKIGDDPAYSEHDMKCERCKTEFHIERHEGLCVHRSSPDYGTYIEINCPYCGVMVSKQIEDFRKG